MLVCQHSWPVVSLSAKLVGGEGSLVRSSMYLIFPYVCACMCVMPLYAHVNQPSL